jgi:hypothetical protein
VLLGNYSVLNRNPLRYLGGGLATPEVNHQPNFNRGGCRKNRQYRGQTTTANKQFSLPYGSYQKYSWLLPQKGGDLAGRRSADFGIGIVGTGGMGMPGDGNADISIVTNNPAGQLVTTVLAGNAPATFGITTNNPLLTASLLASGSTAFGMTTNTPLLGAEASLIGVSSIGLDGTLTRYAIGIMEGTTEEAGVTVNNIVNGVWGYAIEAGYTSEEIIRILAAHAAGSATGLEGANPQFTGLDGTTLRIDGTYSAGTRTIDALNGA